MAAIVCAVSFTASAETMRSPGPPEPLMAATVAVGAQESQRHLG